MVGAAPNVPPLAIATGESQRPEVVAMVDRDSGPESNATYPAARFGDMALKLRTSSVTSLPAWIFHAPYTSAMAQGDVPTSPGGPIRRRREKRQLERLAGEADRREPHPSSAHQHVSIIEDGTTLKAREVDTGAPDERSEPSGDESPRGFHVRPVPIDQPIGESP